MTLMTLLQAAQHAADEKCRANPMETVRLRLSKAEAMVTVRTRIQRRWKSTLFIAISGDY